MLLLSISQIILYYFDRKLDGSSSPKFNKDIGCFLFCVSSTPLFWILPSYQWYAGQYISNVFDEFCNFMGQKRVIGKSEDREMECWGYIQVVKKTTQCILWGLFGRYQATLCTTPQYPMMGIWTLCGCQKYWSGMMDCLWKGGTTVWDGFLSFSGMRGGLKRRTTLLGGFLSSSGMRSGLWKGEALYWVVSSLLQERLAHLKRQCQPHLTEAAKSQVEGICTKIYHIACEHVKKLHEKSLQILQEHKIPGTVYRNVDLPFKLCVCGENPVICTLKAGFWCTVVEESKSYHLVFVN